MARTHTRTRRRIKETGIGQTMNKAYTTFVWDGKHGLLEYSLPISHAMIPPVGALVTTKFPIDGKFETITGQVSEVSVDYTSNEVVLHLKNVEVQ